MGIVFYATPCILAIIFSALRFVTMPSVTSSNNSHLISKVYIRSRHVANIQHFQTIIRSAPSPSYWANFSSSNTFINVSPASNNRYLDFKYNSNVVIGLLLYCCKRTNREERIPRILDR